MNYIQLCMNYNKFTVNSMLDDLTEREKMIIEYATSAAIDRYLTTIKAKHPAVKKEMSLNGLHKLYGYSRVEIMKAFLAGNITGRVLPSGQYRINVSSFIRYFL